MTIKRALPRFEKKVGLTLTVLTLFGLTASAATFAAFSDTTTNSGNVFQAGTVDIDDDDAASALYDAVTNGKPGSTDQGCVKVTFNGSLDSSVKLYVSALTGDAALNSNLDLEITSGTGNAGGSLCTDFAAAGAAGDIYAGTLAAFDAAHSDFSDGLALSAGGNAVWSTAEAVTYRFKVTLQDDNAANNGNAGDDGADKFTTGAHTFTWEAQNN